MIVKEVQREGKVIQSEVLKPGDKEQLSPRGALKKLKYLLFRYPEKTFYPGERFESLGSWAGTDRGYVVNTTDHGYKVGKLASRNRRRMNVLSDDKIEIDIKDASKYYRAYGVETKRRVEKLTFEKEDINAQSEILRTGRMGFPPKEVVFKWVPSEAEPQDH